MKSSLTLSGFRSIEECLHSHPERIQKIIVKGKTTAREEQLLKEAARLRIPVERQAADRKSPHSIDFSAYLKPFDYASFEQILSAAKTKIERGKHPVIVALDGLTDPNNLGAIIRTAAFMGVDGILLPKDRSVSVTETVYRIASGGVEHVPIAQVTNLVSALQELKDAGFWLVGFSEHADAKLQKLKRDFAPVLIIGNEETGMRPLVQKSCDFLVQLSADGKLHSLNASVAAGLAMAWATDLFRA